MDRAALVEQIRSKRSYLCVGLDTDIRKIRPTSLVELDPVFAFNKAIIDVTRDLCVSYKINTAFYEAFGVKGWETLEKQSVISERVILQLPMPSAAISKHLTQYARAFLKPCLLMRSPWLPTWVKIVCGLPGIPGKMGDRAGTYFQPGRSRF